MSQRRKPMTMPDRVASIEEQQRRVAATLATTPVITEYSALNGLPTDLVTVAQLNAALAPLAAAVNASEMLSWLMDDS